MGRLSVACALLLAACTAEQMYATGQTWQRNQCARIPDKADYDRCMASTAGSYEDYRRETEAARK